mgnify:CR=1 FL=1
MPRWAINPLPINALSPSRVKSRPLNSILSTEAYHVLHVLPRMRPCDTGLALHSTTEIPDSASTAGGMPLRSDRRQHTNPIVAHVPCYSVRLLRCRAAIDT